NAAGQANVGHLFRTGDGVGRDYLMAFAWYGVAAAGNYRGAPQYRDSVAEYLTSEELDAARDLARELFIKYGSK
ncbi:MAG: sel1 repeat family protein, partial [Gammaproteobacteria bacterium]|nr:sel1 repeat family protein [Gammaproteobacteria bacterium]MDX2459088.1 sel1 repeat family protein [Gammaproteobacteria bacterium]